MTLADQTVSEFAENLASDDVPPGGGAAAPFCGAFGAALCEMVCNLSIGDDAYAGVEEELIEVREELAGRRQRLLELADEDSEAVEELFAAYGVPEDEGRAAAIQEATRRATEVPLAVAEASLVVLEHAVVATGKGNPNAAADGGIGAYLAHSALAASTFTARTNLETIEDDDFVDEVEARVDEIDRAGEAAMQEVEETMADVV